LGEKGRSTIVDPTTHVIFRTENMSSIIHALTGHGDHAEKKSNSSTVHTVTYEDVKIKSVVSSQTQSKAIATDSQNKINALMAKLGKIDI
jgi:hypothetical protein